MLPYASDHVPSRFPWATWTVLIGTAGASSMVLLAPPARRTVLVTTLALTPAHVRLYTLVTYMLIHAGPAQLLINLAYLWVFGAGVEDALGAGWFFALYVASGVVGGALEWAVTVTLLPSVYAWVPVVGASAACLGLVGLYAARYYRARLSYLGLPFRPQVIVVVALLLVYEIAAGLWNLTYGSPVGGIAHWAHVGGFIFGLGCARVMRLDAAGEAAYHADDIARSIHRARPAGDLARWQAAVAADAGDAPARAELARAWHRLGDVAQARDDYLAAILGYLNAKRPTDAADICMEMDEKGLFQDVDRARNRLTADQLMTIASALEEKALYAEAAEVYRRVAMRYASSVEAEAALLRAAGVYAQRLGRRQEALVLTALFLQRYPHSDWAAYATELQRAASATADPRERG